jgi:hypothetical protein
VTADDRARLLKLAREHELQAARNLEWRRHYRAVMAPGRARRSRLWLLSFHGRKELERAAMLRRFAGVAP